MIKFMFGHNATKSFMMSEQRGYIWRLYGIKLGQTFFGIMTRRIEILTRVDQYLDGKG